MQCGFGRGLLGNIHGDAGLAIDRQDVSAMTECFKFDARFAGNKIAFAQAERTEGLATHLNLSRW